MKSGFPRQLETKPSQPGLGTVSVAGPLRRLAVGVVGGRTEEVEVGEKGEGERGGTETEGFPEGWWI